MFALCILVALLLMALGGLAVMAGMMSDSPAEANATADQGAVAFLIGVVILVIAMIGHFGVHLF